MIEIVTTDDETPPPPGDVGPWMCRPEASRTDLEAGVAASAGTRRRLATVDGARDGGADNAMRSLPYKAFFLRFGALCPPPWKREDYCYTRCTFLAPPFFSLLLN